MSQNIKQPTLSYASSQRLGVLADIYQEHTNIAIWQRELEPSLTLAVANILHQSASLNIACTVAVKDCFDTLFDALGKTDDARILAYDIHFLVDMYSCLFDLRRVALRIAKLDSAMCPKFHVDRVPVRLVTTYQGPGTEWLQNQTVDRSMLGAASVGIADDKSGIYQGASDVEQATVGDVLLLKGESWIGNEGSGIVHRSPSVEESEQRLVVSFDFSPDD